VCKEQYGNEQTCNMLTTFEELLSFAPCQFGPGVEISVVCLQRHYESLNVCFPNQQDKWEDKTVKSIKGIVVLSS
jgi:hypothetical protein